MRMIAALLLVVVGLATGCGGKSTPEAVKQVIPDIPSSADFGPLYPRVNSFLNGPSPDVASALRDTLAWARIHLDGFNDGACGSVQVVGDADFARIFGKTTLGVTLPWMQVYIRDGARDPDPFLWKDASLFVSTVLHEFVHAAQRARQGTAWFGVVPGCENAKSLLESRKLTWTAGFENLRINASITTSYSREERALLYRWISPIQRARDEVDAALTTLRWMHEHRDELNELTIGGANNWAYGVQYINQLKTLSRSTCFSQDDDTFVEEKRILDNDVAVYVAEFTAFERDMKYFLTQHNVPVARLLLSDAPSPALPTGREGARCALNLAAEMPRFPFAPDL